MSRIPNAPRSDSRASSCAFVSCATRCGQSWARYAMACASCIWCLLWMAGPALATQVHDSPEGLYAHQIAHIFFSFSMAILIYWLRGRSLVKETGWRFIQYAAVSFILWNVGAFFSHILEDREGLFQTVHAGFWHSSILFGESSGVTAIFFYVMKMDHLVLLPAIIFLYAGLRRLLKKEQEAELRDGES